MAGSRLLRRALLGLVLLAGPLAGPVRATTPVILDDFEALDGWSALASDGSQVTLAHEAGPRGQALRITFDLNHGGGWVIVRKTFALDLPTNYAFTFELRGEAPRNTFEFKLVDPRGQNVWWHSQRDFTFPADWQRMTVRKSRLEFAWGPSPGKALKQVGAIEFAIAAGEGGTGTMWLDELAFEEREPVEPDALEPTVDASSSVSEHAEAHMLDADPATSWWSAPGDEEQWVVLDLGRNHEYGGLVIDWDGGRYATGYDVQTSSDGLGWATSHTTTTGHGRRDYIYMPDAESRYIRLALHASNRGQGYGIRGLTVQPFAFSASPNQFFEAIARDAPPGTYPKYLSGRQTYWTLVGANGDGRMALLNEEGMLEPARGGFSIEPFLYAGGDLLTRQSVEVTQRLEDGALPIPSVVWEHERVRMTLTAFATGAPGAAVVVARYRVQNRLDRSQAIDFFLTFRPFQVTPPWQSLNLTGGVTRIKELRFEGNVAWVNKRQAVQALVSPDHAGAATFEEGSVTEFLLADRVPPSARVADPSGFASGAMQYHLYLDGKGEAEFDLIIPLHDAEIAALGTTATYDRSWVTERLAEARRTWQAALSRVEVRLPPEAAKVTDTMRTALGHILIEREGPQIRPGPRNYARVWIRDGAIVSSAMLQMGYPEEVRDFVRWYVQFQQPDGKIPCCVDARGPDPVNEHDSAGAFVWTVGEYYRYTRDVGFVHELWPAVVRAVDYLAALRARRLTDEYTAPDKVVFYGLLPESISHEGYSARPVHSFWDDFFALRGLKDAAELATVVGDEEHAAAFGRLRDEFRDTLYASIGRTMATHGIDYLPGSAELGDFDPTSTSIAVAPVGELGRLPEPALTRTYERYWEEVVDRLGGVGERENYSPYEVRNVGTLVRLGQRARALELLQALLADQRPPAWNGWAEVSWRDPAAPRFIGDMPHGWVAAGYLRSVRALFADERERDDTLVIGAGVPATWLEDDAGIAVKRLPTHYGVLTLTMRREGEHAVRVRLSGDLTLPRGGLVVHTPFDRPLATVKVNGRPVTEFARTHVVVHEWPADVMFLHEPPPAP